MTNKLKYAKDKRTYDNNTKKYVLNVHKNTKKLHIKNNKSCWDSRCLISYYDFDTIEDVINSGTEFTKCKKCFKGEE